MVWYTKLDEYKDIAGKICVPSFFTLLLATSVIHLVYSYLIYPVNEIVIPASVFLLSLSLFVVYTVLSQGFRIVTLFFPLLISFVIFLRIISLWNPALDDPVKKSYAAIVKTVEELRYNNEVVIELTKDRNSENTKGERAVCYAEKGIAVNPGDELSLNTKPFIILKNNVNDLSGFELNLLRKGFSCIFYLHRDNFEIITDMTAGEKYFLRNTISENLEKLFGRKTVPVLKALYFGNKSYIDKKTLSEFKRAGVLHVLAASGLHTGIIAGAIFILLAPFLINRKIVFIVISLILLLYLYITDMPVSLLRAFIMYSIFAVQYSFNLERNIFNTLFIAAILVLAINPYELYGMGFQLSFGATFGIILLFKFYNRTLSFLPAPVAKTLSATLSAQVFVFPIIYFHLKEVNLTGILSNLVIILSMSVTLISSLVANLISIVSMGIGEFIASLTDAIYNITLYIVGILSETGGHFYVEKNGLLLLFPYLLFLLPLLPVKKIGKIKPLFIIFSVIISWSILADKHASNEKTVAIMNNDQASVVLLFNGKDRNVIYGELRDIKAAKILVKYFEKNNIKDIEIYIPVPDYKNLKNYLYLIKKSIVSKCCISSDFAFTGYFRKFCKTLDADKIKLKISDIAGHAQKNGKIINENTFKNLFKSPAKNTEKMAMLLSNNLLIDNLHDNYEIEYIDN